MTALKPNESAVAMERREPTTVIYAFTAHAHPTIAGDSRLIRDRPVGKGIPTSIPAREMTANVMNAFAYRLNTMVAAIKASIQKKYSKRTNKSNKNSRVMNL